MISSYWWEQKCIFFEWVSGAAVKSPGLFHGLVQTPLCHQPSLLCFPALSSQQEQREGSRSASILDYTKTHRISILPLSFSCNIIPKWTLNPWLWSHLRGLVRCLHRHSGMTWMCRSSAESHEESNWVQMQWHLQGHWCWLPGPHLYWGPWKTRCTGWGAASPSGSTLPPSCLESHMLQRLLNKDRIIKESNERHPSLYIYLNVKHFLPMTLLVVPPGQPTVERQGPLFPALETNITLCFCTASEITSQILLKTTKKSVTMCAK